MEYTPSLRTSSDTPCGCPVCVFSTSRRAQRRRQTGPARGVATGVVLSHCFYTITWYRKSMFYLTFLTKRHKFVTLMVYWRRKHGTLELEPAIFYKHARTNSDIVTT